MLQEAPAEQCLLHAVLHETTAEHAVFHATLPAGPGTGYQKASHIASPALAPSWMGREQGVLLHLVGAQAAAGSHGRCTGGVGTLRSKGHCLTL